MSKWFGHADRFVPSLIEICYRKHQKLYISNFVFSVNALASQVSPLLPAGSLKSNFTKKSAPWQTMQNAGSPSVSSQKACHFAETDWLLFLLCHECSWCIMRAHGAPWILSDACSHDASWFLLIRVFLMHHAYSWCDMSTHGASWYSLCIIVLMMHHECT